MADNGAIHVEICAPERAPLVFEASEVILPGADGVFSVLAGHTPFLTTLAPGTAVVCDADSAERFFALNEGFAEVLGDRVVVLTQTIEEDSEIDVNRAKAARERAEKRLRQPSDDTNFARAQAALLRSLARLNTHSRMAY